MPPMCVQVQKSLILLFILEHLILFMKLILLLTLEIDCKLGIESEIIETQLLLLKVSTNSMA